MKFGVNKFCKWGIITQSKQIKCLFLPPACMENQLSLGVLIRINPTDAKGDKNVNQFPTD